MQVVFDKQVTVKNIPVIDGGNDGVHHKTVFFKSSYIYGIAQI